MARKSETPAEFLPDFEGFGPKAFAFLKGLAANNDRTWFQENRETYENEVRFPLRCLVAEFARSRIGDRLPVQGDPAKALFRIHRDTRFSANKAPYKTHAGAILSPGGGRDEQGVVYIHITPAGSFVSAGFWRPEPQHLTAWRTRIVEDPDAFADLVEGLTAGPAPRPYMRHISALKTMPRGFSAHGDAPHADYLRWKSFLLTRPLKQAETRNRGLVGIIRAHAERARPLLEYGWEVIASSRERDPRRWQQEG